MAKYISKNTGRPWRGSRRTNAELALVGELGTWPSRKAMREAHRAGNALVRASERRQGQRRAHFEYLDTWRTLPGTNLRVRAGWEWQIAKCKVCRRPRYASLQWASRVSWQRGDGSWVVRTRWSGADKAYRPKWDKPRMDCYCPGRRPTF